mmetsp:Transcript_11043/g.16567  ORF Transcript_11043/g.16567 Transcript_11043/m.16567 type:complete len:86 (-) Transcript_11043:32-289(-)
MCSNPISPWKSFVRVITLPALISIHMTCWQSYTSTKKSSKTVVVFSDNDYFIFESMATYKNAMGDQNVREMIKGKRFVIKVEDSN